MQLTESKASTRIALKNVLLTTDFSGNSHVALPYALAISRHYGSTLHTVHVIPEFNILVPTDPASLDYEREKRSALERIRELDPELREVRHQAHIRRGRIWEVVSEVIAEHHIDLLVLGTHGYGELRKLVLGSVEDELLRRIPCPVLTIGPNAVCRIKKEFEETVKDMRTADIELKQIILAVDFNLECLTPVPLAISLAQEFQAQLGLLYVVEQSQDPANHLVLEHLEGLLPADTELWCRPQAIVKFGVASEKILELASDSRADLIILGVRGAKAQLGYATHFPWSTAHRVIAAAPCPVLTVRN
jgi:nucleotide-binding universal stress UspA family protein